MNKWFSNFAATASKWAGKPITFILALVSMLIWAAFGPYTSYSDSWQLWANTSTTIITFLMVFILQHTQNRDGIALQAKLDTLISGVKNADNAFIGMEQYLTEDEMQEVRAKCKERAEKRAKGKEK